MNELAKKLQIQTGKRVCLLNAVGEASVAIRTACKGTASLTEMLEEGYYDLIFTWPRRLASLSEHFADLQHSITPKGAIWAVMPKKKYAAQRGIDYSWEELQAAGLKTNLVDNKVASISEQDYGTRFVIRRQQRHRKGKHEQTK
jgi:hypothetical protein